MNLRRLLDYWSFGMRMALLIDELDICSHGLLQDPVLLLIKDQLSIVEESQERNMQRARLSAC